MKMKADWDGELQDEATCLDGRMRVKPARNELAGAVRIIHHIQWLYPLIVLASHIPLDLSSFFCYIYYTYSE